MLIATYAFRRRRLTSFLNTSRPINFFSIYLFKPFCKDKIKVLHKNELFINHNDIKRTVYLVTSFTFWPSFLIFHWCNLLNVGLYQGTHIYSTENQYTFQRWKRHYDRNQIYIFSYFFGQVTRCLKFVYTNFPHKPLLVATPSFACLKHNIKFVFII